MKRFLHTLSGGLAHAPPDLGNQDSGETRRRGGEEGLRGDSGGRRQGA